MPIVTFTSDFGLNDYYVALIKGSMLSENPSLNIIDISHNINNYDIVQAAFILKNAFESFPKGTIHIVGVDSELSDENKHIALEIDNHFFVCPDNGLISMIASEIQPTKMVEINIHDRIESSFPVLDVFVNVACFIARGGNLTVIGKEIKDLGRG